MDDIIAKGAFMGFELDNVKSEKKVLSINPGVGLGAEKGNPIYAEILQGFEKLDYYLPDGTRNPFTMIPMVTRMMQDRGLVLKDKMQTIDGITIYPNEYTTHLTTSLVCYGKQPTQGAYIGMRKHG